MPIQRPCLDCHRLTPNQRRCDTCQATWHQQHPKGKRTKYSGNYQQRAKWVRDNATICWICNQPARPDDPWTADHIYPEDDSILLAAHRSCNSARGKPKPTT